MAHIDLNGRLRISKILNPRSTRPSLAGDIIVLGYGTVLAQIAARDGLWHAELPSDDTLQALLLAAYEGYRDPAPMVRAIKRAAHHLLAGDRLGATEALLACGVGDLDETGAEHLFAVDALIKSGAEPRDALAKIIPPMSLAKYDPDEPRDARGRWTTGGASNNADERESDSSDRDGLELAADKQKGATEAEKEKFTDDHLAAAQALADKLHVPVENILGLSAFESGWGNGRFVINGRNNYLSLHYPAPGATGFILATESGVRVATFRSFDDCAIAFYQRYGHLVDGVTDPEKFAATLQDAGLFGINRDGSKDPDYPTKVAQTARGFRSRVARRSI